MPFSVPSINDMVLNCEQQHVAVGILLLAVGLVFMILGVKLYRALIPISFAAVGFAIGVNVPLSEIGQWACAGVCAVVLGVLSSYVTRLSVALLAGGWTGMFAASLAVTFGLQPLISLGIGAVFLVAVASLALSLYNQLIAYVTSLQGAILTVGGIVAFLHHFAFWFSLRSIFVEYTFVPPFFVASLTVMGFYLQLAETRQLESGMSG
jgi:hypothetical protein